MSQLFRGEIYDELPLPSGALRNGGAEMLRAGVVDDELFITARRIFDDPTQWGGLLADVARRLAMLYAAQFDVDEAAAAALIGIGFDRRLAAPYAPAGPRRKRPAAAKSPAPRRKARTKPKPARRRRAKP